MSTNAARRAAAHLASRPEARIFRLPIAASRRRSGAEPDIQAGSRPEPAAPRSGMLVPMLLAVLLVLCCLAWEAMSDLSF